MQYIKISLDLNSVCCHTNYRSTDRVPRTCDLVYMLFCSLCFAALLIVSAIGEILLQDCFTQPGTSTGSRTRCRCIHKSISNCRYYMFMWTFILIQRLHRSSRHNRLMSQQNSNVFSVTLAKSLFPAMLER